MVPIKDKLAKKANYGTARSTSSIKWIVIHYTANDGDSDEGNGNFFANNVKKASAHYFVDDDSITRSVPENYIAYSVAGKKWNNAGGRLYGTVTNANSLSIELCDNVKNGIIYPSADTIANALELVEYLMKKYNIPQHRVIRHYDVNGKPCPSYWTNDEMWESCFHARLGGVLRPYSGPDTNPYKEPTINITSYANARQRGVKVYSSHGDGVKWLQWELCQLGEAYKQQIMASGGIDGVCGNTTVYLLKIAQNNFGLNADGICGPQTRKLLKKN